MPSEHPSSPNPKLRAARLSRNWTLKEAARELRMLMASRGETQVGVTLHHVYRWEVGSRRPGMRYRRYLCLLYGLRPDQLEFAPSIYPISRLAPPAGQAAPWAFDGRSAQPAGTEGDLEVLNLTRRKLLAASGLLSAAIGAETATDAAAKLAEPLDRAARVASGRAAADDQLVTSLRALTSALEHSYRHTAADLLVEPIRAHIKLLKTVLKESLLPEHRDGLLSTASQVTSRMAMLQLIDRNDPLSARRWLTESIAMAEATTDSTMHVLGLGRAALHGIYTGQAAQSAQQLDHARTLADRTCSPSTRSWMLALQAEAYAAAREPKRCDRLLDQAAVVQQRSEPRLEPSWMQGWGPSMVAGFAGAVHLRLGQPRQARGVLHEALAAAEPAEVKSRSIYMADLATTYAHESEVESACELAGKALDIAGPMHFGLTLDRMAALRRDLARWPTNRAVKGFNERLQEVQSA